MNMAALEAAENSIASLRCSSIVWHQYQTMPYLLVFLSQLAHVTICPGCQDIGSLSCISKDSVGSGRHRFIAPQLPAYLGLVLVK